MNSHEKTMLVLAIVGTTATLASMLLTASIALKCNGKLTRKLESFFGIEIAEPNK